MKIRRQPAPVSERCVRSFHVPTLRLQDSKRPLQTFRSTPRQVHHRTKPEGFPDFAWAMPGLQPRAGPLRDARRCEGIRSRNRLLLELVLEEAKKPAALLRAHAQNF